MRILIATGIYPPALGGPAKYAQNLKKAWEQKGNEVVVKTYDFEHTLPSGVRHIYYFFKIITEVIKADVIYALDTFSVGWPAVCAARLCGKKIVMRTGGDFLWESYVERTGDTVLLRNFYKNTQYNWSRKEQVIFKITKWLLRKVDMLIFSTEWQRDIFIPAYGLSTKNIHIIENFYGDKQPNTEPIEKNFIAGTRKLKWKNLDVLKSIFGEIPEATLDLNNYPHEDFMKRISECYATILVSLGDISPNMILESIRYSKPFIITEENGLMNRIKDIAITIDPKNPVQIKEKIFWLCKKENYDAQVEKLKKFTFTHSWEEIAQEVTDLYKTL
jgi:glycosyltransferase involved in cell wall biosynthesis